MTPEELRRLIVAGETLQTEFKGEEKGRLNDRDLVEAVACLANRSNGDVAHLLVGVEDDRRITGAKPRHGATTEPNKLEALIRNQTLPPLSCAVALAEIDGLPVLVVEVPRGNVPIGTSRGVYVRRVLGGQGAPECVPMSFAELQSLQSGRGQLDLTEAVVHGVTWADLDPLEIERFRRTIRESRGRGDESLVNLSDLELAKAIGAVDGTHSAESVRLLGLLLFGKEEAMQRHLPNHEVAFQVLSGLEVRLNDFFRLPLLRVMDECLLRFRARNEEREVHVGMLRVGVPNYPERAFREALANALIHRDYARQGAVHVQWHDGRIEISNPGGLPEGVRLDNILVTPPRPRNPRLADAFKRAGVVERTARGVDTIFYEQLRTGRPAPSYARSTPTDVVLVLPGGKANLEFVRLVVELSQEGRDLGLNDLLVLNHLQLTRRVTSQEAATLTQQSQEHARQHLEMLVESGLVEPRGERKGRTYNLSASIYRKLGEKAEYVRLRGFEPLQQEQLVLKYVDAHGAISRAETADLCKLSAPQAYRLLKKLVEQGQLETSGGRGRYVVYQRPSRH